MLRTFAPAAVGIAVAGTSWAADGAAGTRTLSFYNIHTKENVTITFKKDGEYVSEGLKQINHIMRDWRRDEPTDMDPELIDTIWELYRDVGATKPIHLVSGYRSRKTNERLRRRGGGQARKSQHILGKAADIHFPGVTVKKLRNSALVREVGGVGYYPKSGLPFVHVDTGRVRNWPRLPRQELAALFPSGKSKYIPSDGRPITKRDSVIAMAKIDKKIDDFITRKSKIKMPRMMMASFVPQSLKWPKASPETTASIPRETPPKRMQMAALGRQGLEEPAPLVIKAPAPTPKIALSSLDRAEHPAELTFGPFTVLPLMSDASVSLGGVLAQLTAPGADDANYLLKDPEGSFSPVLASGSGYRRQVKLVMFGSRQPEPGKKLLRTASR